MNKLIRIALFALPLAGGAAWAQGSGTSGSSGAPGTVQGQPPVTDDTRTLRQQKAGRIDDAAPVLPGDATKPVEVPNRLEERSAPPPIEHTTPAPNIDEGKGTLNDSSNIGDRGRTNGDLGDRDRLDSDK